jgi:tetrahydromethanopterin S-methyltransferase subunit A
MLMSLLAEPDVRWLVLCGDESRRRRQGEALRCLFDHGVGPDGEILGTRHRSARLPVLRSEEVETVRRQVAVRDLSGVQELDRIRAAVAECRSLPVEPLPRRSPVTPSETIAVPERGFRLKQLDPAGFFVILVDRGPGSLFVEHYGPDRILRHRLTGKDADSLCSAIVEWGLVSRLDHAAYLGRELARAEIALRHGLNYRQDAGVKPPHSLP